MYGNICMNRVNEGNNVMSNVVMKVKIISLSYGVPYGFYE